MKLFSKTFALLAIILTFTSSPSNAETIEIARDHKGGILKDKNGNCVRTKWMTDQCCDPCGYEDLVYIDKEPEPTPEIIVRDKMVKYTDLIRQSVYFDNDKFNIDADDKRRMEEVIREINNSQGIGAVRFIGYADRHATDAYNIKLSRKRALQVINYFNNRGYFRQGDVQYGFFGERRPVTECPENIPVIEEIACLQADRRVDIEVELIRERIETVKETVYRDSQGNIISATNERSKGQIYQPDPSIDFEDIETLRRNVRRGR